MISKHKFVKDHAQHHLIGHLAPRFPVLTLSASWQSAPATPSSPMAMINPLGGSGTAAVVGR